MLLAKQRMTKESPVADSKIKTLRHSPILGYLDEISRKDKFKYILIALVAILLFYRLNLHWTIWVGLLIGLCFVYYLNERQAQEMNTEADQLWEVLKSPLLERTKYFIGDPPLIRWADNVSDLKKFNVVEFNKMIDSLDRFLKLIHEISIGVSDFKVNLDLLIDLKVKSLNQFHSLIYRIDNADLVPKFNYYFEQLGKLLNDRHAKLVRMGKMYYILKPVDISSGMAIQELDEPTPDDQTDDGHYKFYNGGA